MRIQQKVQLAAALPLVLLITACLAFTANYTYNALIDNAREEGMIAVQMARQATLQPINKNGMHSLNGSPLLVHLRKMSEFMELRLIRGEAVTREYGSNNKDRSRPLQGMETTMLRNGTVSQGIITRNGHTLLHYNGPLVAKKSCLKCHHVQPGTILGGLSVQVNLSRGLTKARTIFGILIALAALITLIIILGLRRMIAPIAKTASAVERVVSRGRDGDFSARITDVDMRTDEVRKIVESTNHFMESLEKNIGVIARDVGTLTGLERYVPQTNMITYTSEVVSNLVRAARFKKSLEGDRNLKKVYRRLHNLMRRDFELERFGIYEANPDENRMMPVIMEGLPEEKITWCSPSNEQDADTCRVKHTGQIADRREDPDICPEFCSNCPQEMRELMHVCLPIHGAYGVNSVVQIVFRSEESEQLDRKLPRIRYLLDVAAPEIESKRLLQSLKESSMRDPLTGLFNRRFLNDLGKNLSSSILRREASLGILMADIDHFKQVNDNHGHQAGDTILREIAEIFVEELRAGDQIVRYGGEEILALLNDIDEREIINTAERIRHRVERQIFETGAGPVSCSLSIGIAMFPEDSMHIQDAIKYADIALYQAKEQGRNRAIRFREKMRDSSIVRPTGTGNDTRNSEA